MIRIVIKLWNLACWSNTGIIVLEASWMMDNQDKMHDYVEPTSEFQSHCNKIRFNAHQVLMDVKAQRYTAS